jgi:molybdopterin-guanine dinucleotide biosynthesis protein A
VIVGGILLTGGTSRRLGTDKAALVLDGSTLAARAAAALTDRGLFAIEVGPGHSALPARSEDPAGGGPLAALVAGAAELSGAMERAPDAVVLLACDLPHPGAALDALLAAPDADLVVPGDDDGRAQYVCARYSTTLVRQAAALLATGARALRSLADTVPSARRIEVAGLPVEALADIDTPADARRWGAESPR